MNTFWKKVSASFVVIFISITISFLSFLIYHYRSLYIKEKNQTEVLQKKIDEFNKVIPPYYEAQSFKKPTFTQSNLPTGDKKVKIPIIMYHYVEYVKDEGDLVKKKLNIVPHEFEDHLKALSKAKYDTYFVKDIPDILSGSIEYSTRSAVLTFDDGYKDFYTVVFPLLKKYHMRATVFIIVNFIDRSGFLSQNQIKELINSDLVEIGSHTLSHAYLKRISKDAEEKQIVQSKKRLEELFAIPVESFAYPYGAFHENAVELVQKAGYVAAVTVVPGVMQSENDVLLLNRIRPGLFSSQNMIQVIEKMQK